MASVSNRLLSTESTQNLQPSQSHQPKTLQQSTSRRVPRFHSTCPIPLSPTSTVSELMVKAPFVNLLNQHSTPPTPPLSLTNIEKFNSLNLQCPQPTWPVVAPTTPLVLGPSSSCLVSSKPNSTDEETSSNFRVSADNINSQITCEPTALRLTPQKLETSFSPQVTASCISPNIPAVNPTSHKSENSYTVLRLEPQKSENSNFPQVTDLCTSPTPAQPCSTHDRNTVPLHLKAGATATPSISPCLAITAPHHDSEALGLPSSQPTPNTKPPRHPNKKRFHPYSTPPPSKNQNRVVLFLLQKRLSWSMVSLMLAVVRLGSMGPKSQGSKVSTSPLQLNEDSRMEL
jgi:hypothetical protein